MLEIKAYLCETCGSHHIQPREIFKCKVCGKEICEMCVLTYEYCGIDCRLKDIKR